MATHKKIPHFDSEDEERAFWASHEIEDYFDVSKAVTIEKANPFPNLQLSEDLIEFTIPNEEIAKLESVANKYHLSRHALARKFVLEALNREQNRPSF